MRAPVCVALAVPILGKKGRGGRLERKASAAQTFTFEL